MRQILLAALVAVISLALAPTATAQSLEEGTWTGSMRQPGDGDGFDISYEVTMDGDVLKIVLLPPEDADEERYEFNEIGMDDGNLVFWWQPGPRVDCVLEPLEGGGWEGECSDASGETGIMTMLPPGYEED